MKKLLKICLYLLIFFLIIASVSYLIIFRNQEIDVGLIPNEFEYCGSQIYGSNPEYREIVAWLKANKYGWHRSYAT
ncbi:MAG: hypothetical protein AAF304_04645, partial [Pseudomonadota bacterium]